MSIRHFDLTNNDIGRKVIYRHKHGVDLLEEGIITSYNDKFVFVKYGADSFSKATKASDLTFLGNEFSDSSEAKEGGNE